MFKDYLTLFVYVIIGIVSLLGIVVIPVLWLLLEILPYGITCFFRDARLKSKYKFLYFLPTFVKDLTSVFRKD